MDEPPRKSGKAEVRGEYVMKSTRSEETRMSVLDDYLMDRKISVHAESMTRNGKDCAIPIHGSISLRIEQASARAIAPSEIEPDLTAGDAGLKVFGEAAVAVEPSEGSL